MAQYVVTSSNGTFTIKDLQQICSIEGQSVQFVVDDSNGTNVLTQPTLVYTPAEENNEQGVIQTQTINIGNQLDQRQNVYIIKTNDSTAPPAIVNKSIIGTTKIQTEDKVNKEQLITCYAPPETEWVTTKDNSDTIELVLEDPSNLRTFVSTGSRNSQHILATQVVAGAPNVVVQAPGPNQRGSRIVPAQKRLSIASPVATGTLLHTGQRKTGPATGRGGKMKRISGAQSLPGSPNVTVARQRVTTVTSTGTHVVTTPRAPQPRAPIHPEQQQQQQRLLARKTLPTPNLGLLSECIKEQQANLRLRQQQQQQQLQTRQQPVLAVVPTPRVSQSPVPRQKSPRMGQIFNRQQPQLQQQTQLQQQPQQQIRPQLHQLTPQHQVQHQAQHQVHRQVQHQVQPQHHQQSMLRQPNQHTLLQISRQSSGLSDETDEEQPMEVDEVLDGVNIEQSEALLNSIGKPNVSEDNSSESIAYLRADILDPANTIVQHQINGNEAKMLVILENGEQRLITFEVPKEDCTVADLLEQASIQSNQDPHVSLVSDKTLGINYIVDVTKSSAQEEEPMIQSTVVPKVEAATPVKGNNLHSAAQASISPRPPKYITGRLAVCSFCGMSAMDFNQCMRCKRLLPPNVKSIPIFTSGSPKKDTALPVDTFYKKSDSGLAKLDRETTPRRGRGRGRGAANSRAKLVKEPECLTISSDEDDDNKKQKKTGENHNLQCTQATANSEEAEQINEKEPIITNTSITNERRQYGIRFPGVAPHNPPTVGKVTSMLCRTVRIGSYKYAPCDKVSVTSEGLKLEVPLLEDEKSRIQVDIKYKDIVKVLIHFSKAMPVLFFYTNVETGLRIRDLLGMQDPKGPYYDPASKDHTHKRITLLPEKLLEDTKTKLKEIFGPIFEELSVKEANDILVKASPKAVNPQVQSPAKKVTTVATTNNTSSNGFIQTITVYPAPPAKGGIAINTEDFICLAEDQFLNDVIIDFYLKYLTLEVLSKADHQRTHVFSSYFYKRLTSPHAHATPHSESLSPAAKRHARVHKWTKNVNIFEKDFIVIPINEHAHWFLAIICFPGLVGTVIPKVEKKPESQKEGEKKKKEEKVKSIKVGNTTITAIGTITIDTNDDGSERDEAEGDDEEMETDSEEDEEQAEPKQNSEQVKQEVKQEIKEEVKKNVQNKEVTKVPCILIFDSLAGASRSRVVATLRDYLSCEYQKKMGQEKIFSKDTIKGACPKVPQQSNFTDCGLYVLQYVESFFQTPITDYTLPIKTLKTWFEEIVVTRKREEIANLLIKLVNDTKGTKTINLPTLTFPTQDGILKQKSEGQLEIKPAVKVETEKKKTSSETAENKPATSTVNNADSSSTSGIASTPESKQSETVQATIPSDANTLVTSTTDGNITVQQETTLIKTTTDTLTFLKTKRIPRLQKSSENVEDSQAAKKHKGESFDTCK